MSLITNLVTQILSSLGITTGDTPGAVGAGLGGLLGDSPGENLPVDLAGSLPGGFGGLGDLTDGLGGVGGQLADLTGQLGDLAGTVEDLTGRVEELEQPTQGAEPDPDPAGGRDPSGDQPAVLPAGGERPTDGSADGSADRPDMGGAANPQTWMGTALASSDHRGLDVQSGGWRPQPVGYGPPQTPDWQLQAWQPGTWLGAEPATGLSGYLGEVTRAVLTAAHTTANLPPARLPGPAGGSAPALASAGGGGPGPGGGPGGGWRGDTPTAAGHDHPGNPLTGQGADLDGTHAATAHQDRMDWLAAAHGFHDPDRDPSTQPTHSNLSSTGGATGRAWLTGSGMAVPTRDGGTLTLTPTTRSPYARTTPDLAQGRYLIHIDNAQAPGSYQFRLDMPAGAHAVQNTTGGVDILGAGGATVQTIAAPWARDAHGRDLPTRFQVGHTPDGATVLTQHVGFDDTTAFPVLADPDTGTETAAGEGTEGGGTDGAGEGGTGGGEGGEPAGGGETGAGDGAEAGAGEGADAGAGDGADAEAGAEGAGVEDAGADPAGAGENTDAPAATTHTDTETNDAATDGQTDAGNPPPAGGQQDPHAVPSTVDDQPVTISFANAGAPLEEQPPPAGDQQADPPPGVEPAGSTTDSSPGCVFGGNCKPPNSGGPETPLPGQGPQVPPPVGGQQDPPPVVEPAGSTTDSSPGCVFGGNCAPPPNSGGPQAPLPGQGPQPDQPPQPGGPPTPERQLPDPPKGGTSRANAEWWGGLSQEEKDRVITEHPDWVGNRNGIPASVRNKANRDAFDKKVEEFNNRITQIEESLAGPPLLEEERKKLNEELAALKERTGGTTAVTERLNAGGLLLGFEPDAGNGRVIVATGDPDTADNIIIFVPGTGADLPSAGGDLARTEKMVQKALQAARGKVTVGITWVGYDAPPNGYEAVFDSYADDAAPRLRSFQEGLRVTHTGPTPSRNTVVGHSYGSTVIGHTARDGTLDADAVVFVGSPGVGVDDVSGLFHDPSKSPEEPRTGLPDGAKVYSTTSEGDWIEWVAGHHGTDPASPNFGAAVFRADPDGGHSGYWTDLNPALDSFGRIAVGLEPVP